MLLKVICFFCLPFLLDCYSQLGKSIETSKRSYDVELNTLKLEQRWLKDTLSSIFNVMEGLLDLKTGKTHPFQGGHQALYVRWGRNDCPANGTELVYKGYTAGRHYTEGGGTNILCLAEEPTWGRYMDTSDSHRGYIWGTEIDISAASEGKVFEKNVHGDDLPCALCTTRRSLAHMFPGRASCFPGWTLEYSGYLMASYKGRAHSIEYICVDAKLEAILGGELNDHLNVLYLVEAKCGSSIHCPPYVGGREIACAVCSK